jgi:2-polyprenyl-3-methyl-5-hydroxy-6-metoxy-1,4-benzoquinol methylase
VSVNFLRERSFQGEWMDEADASRPAFEGALRDLGRINRWSMAARPVLGWLDGVAQRSGARALSVLDVGAGGGDMLARVAAWGVARGVALDLVGLDRSPWAAGFAARAGVPARYVTSDLFEHEATHDVVICSLFAHHLDDAQAVRFLRWMEARARLGWLISDLHRHWLPWAFLWGATRALRMDPMVVHDSTRSVERGFVRADWERLAAAAGVSARVRWSVPFKWIVTGGPHG